VVYILDNTFSRQAGNGFASDRDRLARDLERAPAGTESAVVELTAAPKTVVPFSADKLVASKSLTSLEPSFEHGSYLAAFRHANGLLAHARGRRKRIVMLGDNQAGQWNENVSTPPFLRNIEVEVARNVSGPLPNIWLTDPVAQRVYIGDSSKVNISFRLGHLGPARSAHVVVEANGQPVLDRDVDLQSAPEMISIQAQCEAKPSEWLRIEARVTGRPDSLPADNNVFCSVPPVSEGQVILLAQSPYLRVGLSREVMRGHWNTRILDPASLAAELQRNPGSDILCIESSFLQGSQARALVKQHLDTGRGVFLVVNRISPGIDGFLRELGFEVERVFERESSPGNAQMVIADHSIFQAFNSPDFGNLGDLRILPSAILRSKDAQPQLLSSSGNGLFFESTRFRGKLLVSAFGMDREHTSWPVHPSFIPFLDLVLQAARPSSGMRLNFEPGELAVFEYPQVNSGRELILSRDGTEVQRVRIDQARALLRLPGKPGLYAAHLDGSTNEERILSVNASPMESELTFLDSPRTILDGWTVHGSSSALQQWSSAGGEAGFSAILGQRFWWWMLLAGVVALVFETGLVDLKGERL
jgi:hypothetical protein